MERKEIIKEIKEIVKEDLYYMLKRENCTYHAVWNVRKRLFRLARKIAESDEEFAEIWQDENK